MKFLALLCLVGCCPTLKWSKADYVLEGAFVAATVVDGIQSRHIVDQCWETNPIIGDCGERVPLGLYIPLSIIVQAGIAALLPDGWRTAWLGFTAGAEADTVYANSIIEDNPRPFK